jgi:hypothetical protein
VHCNCQSSGSCSDDDDLVFVHAETTNSAPSCPASRSPECPLSAATLAYLLEHLCPQAKRPLLSPSEVVILPFQGRVRMGWFHRPNRGTLWTAEICTATMALVATYIQSTSRFFFVME